jgi:hypothetical protein
LNLAFTVFASEREGSRDAAAPSAKPLSTGENAL